MKIEFSPNIPIYIQVMEYIKKEIVTGHLSPGSKIPSVRELASELQVNPNTIQRTFQELEREGIVVTRRGMGRYVVTEGEKIMELRKGMAKELLHAFINGMNNLGFSEEEMLSILHSSLEEKKGKNRCEN
ncbi:GntR family transcriptional regulator [Bacillus sp. S14(2024)]|uniref:GntR family transcriptional regulator n=1 Tax=Bacillus sp. S14(2024) TaxID=3162884 RepID=UPI003D262160